MFRLSQTGSMRLSFPHCLGISFLLGNDVLDIAANNGPLAKSGQPALFVNEACILSIVTFILLKLSCIYFLRNCQKYFQSCCTILHSHLECVYGSVSLWFYFFVKKFFGCATCGILVTGPEIKPCVCLLHWKHRILTTGLPRKSLSAALVHFSLITDDVEHIFMCWSVIWISTFMKCLFKSFFKWGCLSFYDWVVSYIFWYNSFVSCVL